MTPQEYQANVMELISPICDTDQVSVDISTITSLCKVAAIFDLQKRQMFYAKKPLQRRLTEDMIRIDGITAAARLALKDSRLLGKTYAECGVDPDLIHACIGLVTEVGEIWEELLKAMADGGRVNLDNLQEELGDLGFYQAYGSAVAERLDDNCGRFTPEGIQTCNMAKLHTRYPNKAASVVAILSKLPLDIVQQIKDGKFRVWLSPNICSVVFGEKQPYERYPVPIACHAEEALELKYMLLQMDKATAKSVRDKILKVTVGTDKFPEFDPGKIKALAQIFQNPSRNLTIFWNHTLNLEWIEPQNTLLADEKKYAHCNNEIRTCFGVSSVITGTSDKGGSVGDGIMNLKGVEEEVDEAQDAFLEWFDKEVELLQQALGVKFKVTGQFDRMNLKDEATFMALLLQLYQNGLIDPQTAIETMRFNYPSIVKRLEAAIKQRKKGIFVPMPSSNNMGPDGTMVQKGPSAGPGKGGIGGGKSGKPSNQPKKANQQKAGTSQPKMTKTRASLIPSDDGITCHLVVTSALDVEEREHLAEQFMIPTEWIVTEDQYLKATGKRMDWLTPLPALDVMEFVDVMAKANTLVTEVDQECEGTFEAIRSTGTGKRGKYVTDATKSDTRHTLAVALIAKLRPENVEEVEWTARHERAVAEVASKSKAMKLDEDGTHLFAAAMVAHQYAKRAAKVAA